MRNTVFLVIIACVQFLVACKEDDINIAMLEGSLIDVSAISTPSSTWNTSSYYNAIKQSTSAPVSTSTQSGVTVALLGRRNTTCPPSYSIEEYNGSGDTTTTIKVDHDAILETKCIWDLYVRFFLMEPYSGGRYVVSGVAEKELFVAVIERDGSISQKFLTTGHTTEVDVPAPVGLIMEESGTIKLISTKDGNPIIYTLSASLQLIDERIIEYTSSVFPGTNINAAGTFGGSGAAKTSNNKLLVMGAMGTTSVANTTTSSAIVHCVNEGGSIDWQLELYHSEDNNIHLASNLKGGTYHEGAYYLVGNTNFPLNTDGIQNHLVIMKVDESGKLLWQKAFDGVGHGAEIIIKDNKMHIVGNQNGGAFVSLGSSYYLQMDLDGKPLALQMLSSTEFTADLLTDDDALFFVGMENNWNYSIYAY